MVSSLVNMSFYNDLIFSAMLRLTQFSENDGLEDVK